MGDDIDAADDGSARALTTDIDTIPHSINQHRIPSTKPITPPPTHELNNHSTSKHAHTTHTHTHTHTTHTTQTHTHTHNSNPHTHTHTHTLRHNTNTHTHTHTHTTHNSLHTTQVRSSCFCRFFSAFCLSFSSLLFPIVIGYTHSYTTTVLRGVGVVCVCVCVCVWCGAVLGCEVSRTTRKCEVEVLCVGGVGGCCLWAKRVRSPQHEQHHNTATANNTKSKCWRSNEFAFTTATMSENNNT